MTIHPIPAFSDNYIWAIIDKAAGIFDCIDPGDAKPVLQFAMTHQLKLRAILLTHHHQDHIGGVAELVKAYPASMVYGPNDARIPHMTNIVQEQQTLHLAPYTFTILFNPGHTSSHISYYESQHQCLFCGDTLFSAGCGRVFDGTLEQLHQSLCLFKKLPPSTKIFCAHEYTEANLRFAQKVEPDNLSIQKYVHHLDKNSTSCTLPSTLEQELLINPFLRTQETEVQKFAFKHGATSNSSLEVFRILRQEKNIF